jgi:4'-phosphopantetheinyl transferase
MLELDPREIHLWLTFLSDSRDDRLLSEYWALMDEAERVQAQRFHFPHDRHRYINTRALVRTTLSRYVSLSPANWRFGVNAYGRPEIQNEGPGIDGVSFNITHTEGLVAVAVTRRAALGVDAENTRVRCIPMDLAERYFAAEEVASLRGLPPEQRPDRSFEYWTLKESYIKARGMGLSIPLDRFGFQFPGQREIEIRIAAKEGDAAERWRFWQLAASNEHLIALCCERIGHQAPALVSRRVLPLLPPREMHCAIKRASKDCLGDSRATSIIVGTEH